MKCTILDCYTDEAAGLGVPPYIGTYPRYLAGKLLNEGQDVEYITIDDLRYWKAFDRRIINDPKTNIRSNNLTGKDAEVVLNSTEVLYVICGVHVPGKYLSALPGTLNEITKFLAGVNCKKILCGPAATEFGTRLEGGKKAEGVDTSIFDSADALDYSYNDISKYAIAGAGIVKQIPYELIAEIETARGCRKSIACSFCTEPLKNKLSFRKVEDIISEAKVLHEMGIRHYRLGKQSDFFLWEAQDIIAMLKGIRDLGVKTLHIDNIDPATVSENKVKALVEYCTEGNVAAMGCETFDAEIVKANKLNSNPAVSLKAIKLINKFGRERGENGMHKFLPGINILFGLKGENKKTHVENMKFLQQLLDEDLLVRRINVRQVAIFPGTQLDKDCGDKYIKKNKKFYWKWRNDIRQKVDNKMLQKVVPVDQVLKDVRMEVHDGNTTFGRQFGTYPLIVGVKEKLKLGKFYNIKVVGHMLRSVIGKVSKAL